MNTVMFFFNSKCKYMFIFFSALPSFSDNEIKEVDKDIDSIKSWIDEKDEL